MKQYIDFLMDVITEGGSGGGGGSAVIEALNVTENGTYEATGSVDGYSPVTVSVGRAEVEEKDVNFIDHDGLILYSYTAEEFAELAAFPPNPTRAGLISQGWNWDFEHAQAYVAKYGSITIGQMYITDDGSTRIYVHMLEGRLHPYLGICVNGEVSVDWGDGTATDTLTGTTLDFAVNADHVYEEPGDYVITLTVLRGNFSIMGSAYSTYLLRKSATNQASVHRVYADCIQKIELGANVSLSYYALVNCGYLESVTVPEGLAINGSICFQSCYALRGLVLPSGIEAIPDGMFSYCYSLSAVSIPEGVSSIGANAFSNTLLRRVLIPDGVTTLGNSIFQSDYAITSIVISESVTSIGSSAFSQCYGVAEYHFTSATPPTLASSNVFQNIQSDCIIYVPKGSLEAYQTATNWTTVATYMQEEP